jgi:hemolysin activation/secretion protein
MMRCAVFAAAMLAAAQAAAQAPIVPPSADPGALQQRQIDEERRRQDAERERRRPSTEPVIRQDAPAPRAPGSGADTLRFLVREIRFTPSELLKAEELEAIAREFRGRELTLSELQGITGRVNDLYKSKGIVTAQAAIPPQDVSEGIVQVRLIEGRVGKLNVDGNATTREGYVTSRLSLKPTELIDLQRLEQAIVRYNRTNDTQMRAELKPGAEFGTTDVYVTLAEPARHDLRLSLDNSGSPTTGRWRESLNYANRSLLGYRDELTVSTSVSDGHHGASLGYSVPFNTWGGRISYAFYDDATRIKNGPLQTLNITGESTANIFTVRQPVVVEEKVQFDLLGGAKKRVSSNYVDTTFLQRTETVDRNLGGELQLTDGPSYWLANFTRAWGYADVLNVSRTEYRIDRANLRHTRELPGGLSLHANLSLQSSPQQSLPSSEQLFIGGEGSVRGYDVGAFSGNHGYTLNLELHHPLMAAKAGEDVSQGVQATGFFFVDYGVTFPFRPPNTGLRPYERLSSVGWGVNASLGRHWYGRATFAYGLVDLPLMARNYTLLFQAVASAF